MCFSVNYNFIIVITTKPYLLQTYFSQAVVLNIFKKMLPSTTNLTSTINTQVY